MSTPFTAPTPVRVSDLDEPSRDTLEKPPLELVVCQIRHEAIAGGIDASLVPSVQDRLSQWITRVEQLQGPLGVAPGAFIPPGGSPQVGWRFIGDSGWIVSLTGDSYAVECSRYTTWSAFEELLTAVTELVSESYAPRLAQRIGLRFVDRFVRSESSLPAQWRGLLDTAVLGFGAHQALADATLVAQSSSELLIEGMRANIRGSIAGDATPNGYSFLLDTDCFDERVRPFGMNVVSSSVSQLHDLHLRLFQTIVTPAYYDELHG